MDDPSRWSAEDLDAVAHALNTRPRKVLDWQTPAGARDEHGTSTGRARDGVMLHIWPASRDLPQQLSSLVDELAPDLVVLPNDDQEWALLEAALTAAPGRVVCFVHTLQQLPFGPAAFVHDRRASELFRSCAGHAAVSRAAQRYLLDYGGCTSQVVHPHVYENIADAAALPPGRDLVMINPSAYKGIDIFLALAHEMPDQPFVAVRGWATSDGDLEALSSPPNVQLHPPYEDVTEVLTGARALLMPSLWQETLGYTAVETMLLGVPVLAGAVGGLVEAKLGVPYSIPVETITEMLDSGPPWRPDCVVPTQDVRAWRDAVDDLTDDTWHRTVAEASRAAARRFVAGIDATVFGRFLETTSDRVAGVTGGAA